MYSAGAKANFTQDFPQRRPELEALRALWAQKAEHGLPSRGDFSARELKSWLPHISFVAVTQSPRRFQVRLMGTESVRIAGGDYTGQFIDECVVPKDREMAEEPYHAVCNSRAPVRRKSVYTNPGHSRTTVYVKYLPCSNDGETVDTILAAVYGIEEVGLFYPDDCSTRELDVTPRRIAELGRHRLSFLRLPQPAG